MGTGAPSSRSPSRYPASAPPLLLAQQLPVPAHAAAFDRASMETRPLPLAVQPWASSTAPPLTCCRATQGRRRCYTRPAAPLHKFVGAATHGRLRRYERSPTLLHTVGRAAAIGPGCSSLGYGAMQELGPFRVSSQDNKTLMRNLNAWNSVANVIFLESPAGVGYSYSNTSADYDLSGDQRTADDAYIFLVKWLERFPEFKNRAFYISGESYAGHYVPELAATILLHNTYNNRTIVNLKGVLVGNPYLDDNINSKGKIDFFWTHGVMSDEVYANVTKHCNFDSAVETPSSEAACNDAFNVFDKGEIDSYNIYAPVCLEGPNGKYYPSSNFPGYDPCSDIPTEAYLNDPAVQNAFHARARKWEGCSTLRWKDAPMSMLPTVKFLVDSKLPVWIFSGDFDSVCPLHATRHAVLDLALPVTIPWRPWTAKEEVGGYVQQYAGGFTFLTVRGAGHMVPSFQPERALIMLSSFLNGPLPA